MPEGEQQKQPEPRKPLATEKPVRTGETGGARAEQVQKSESNKPLATEKPIPAGETSGTEADTHQWIVTISNRDGSVVKVEKTDPRTGQREELSRVEHAAVYAYLTLWQAYWKGVADLTAALSPGDRAALQAYYQQLTDSYKVPKPS
jgi:hypothetical protein